TILFAQSFAHSEPRFRMEVSLPCFSLTGGKPERGPPKRTGNVNRLSRTGSRTAEGAARGCRSAHHEVTHHEIASGEVTAGESRSSLTRQLQEPFVESVDPGWIMPTGQRNETKTGSAAHRCNIAQTPNKRLSSNIRCAVGAA